MTTEFYCQIIQFIQVPSMTQCLVPWTSFPAQNPQPHVTRVPLASPLSMCCGTESLQPAVLLSHKGLSTKSAPTAPINERLSGCESHGAIR
jgi:hypothetical protein